MLLMREPDEFEVACERMYSMNATTACGSVKVTAEVFFMIGLGVYNELPCYTVASGYGWFEILTVG